MENKIIISYRWWRTDGKKSNFGPVMQAALEEHAEERISEMMQEGYTSGELHFSDDIQGHWEVTTERVK